jgi:voltage-gated potassium channel
LETRSSTFKRNGNAYSVFILTLTVFSLCIMVAMLLPLSEAAIGLLRVYDNLICVFFLIDFFISLRAAPKKADYFIKDRGWLDLLGSIPALGPAFRYSGLFRLARLSRATRIARQLRGLERGAFIREVLENRSEYTGFITLLLVIIVLGTAGVLELQFESQATNATIVTGWDAIWYSIVTITTVGYGDYYPVTIGGRITAIFIMFSGVGLIGVLASLLSHMLMGTSPTAQPSGDSRVERELADVKSELAALRQLLEKNPAEADREPPGK